MVLRHIRPPVPATAIVDLPESDEADDESCPIDLSNKHASSHSEVPRNLTKQLSSTSHTRNPSRNTLGLCRAHGEERWHPSSSHVVLIGNDDSSLDGSDVPSADQIRQNFIPLSRIQARYQQRHEDHHFLTSDDCPEEQRVHVSPSPESQTPDKVLTKRARLDCLISHIKQSKPLHHRPGPRSTPTELGDDHTSSLRTSPSDGTIPYSTQYQTNPPSEEDDEPFNLACANSKHHSSPPPQSIKFETWKTKGPLEDLPPLSPTEAAKAYGMDPETFQQQMMQLQLTSTAMMGDGGGLIKGMHGYPPWFILNYYSQLFHNFQAQQILHQYALQNNNSTSAVIPEEKSPGTPRSTHGLVGYNCQSPLSPASLSEGQLGGDSDGGSVGQMTSACVNGKRAPRAMTGRHVRTGTGASPATLQTLRLKIEERQRLKAQQLLRTESDSRQLSKNRNGTPSGHLTQHSLKLHKKNKK